LDEAVAAGVPADQIAWALADEGEFDDALSPAILAGMLLEMARRQRLVGQRPRRAM